MFDGAKSLFDLISEKRKQDLADSYVPGYADAEALDPIAGGHEDESEHGFHLQMRRKRQTALLKKMLLQGGDPGLAKSFTVVRD